MTSRLRVAIVDDEPLSRRAMRQLLDARDDVEVIAEHDDATHLDVTGLDVVFLDIQMPGRSGLEVARELTGDGAPAVVFVTAFDEYAVAAFDTEAADYLTKPTAPDRLARALDRVRERRRAVRPPPHLACRIGTRDVFVPLGDIERIEGDGIYSAVHAGGRRLLLRRSLDALERELSAADFLRVHRSWLVRRPAIVQGRRTSDGQRELVLASGTVVPISRRRRALVARALGLSDG